MTSICFLVQLQYVETLEEQVADLEESSRISEDVIEVYKHHVSAISSALQHPELSDICRLVRKIPQHGKLTSPLRKGSNASNLPTNSPERIPDIRSFQDRKSVSEHKNISERTDTKISSTPKTSDSAKKIRPIALSEAAKSKIENEKRVHESLTDELVSMASALKENTLNMETKVKERGDLLETTENALDRSLTETQASKSKAESARKRSRWNFCLSILVIFIIGIGFAAMFVFIRVTSIAGYHKESIRKQEIESMRLDDDTVGIHADNTGLMDYRMRDEL